jgi:hypothetical protein
MTRRYSSMLFSFIIMIALTVAVPGTPARAQDPVSPSQGPSLAVDVWTSLYRSNFSEGTPGCIFDYGPQGMRNIYCYLSSVFNYRKLVHLSGQDPFVSGPHSSRALDLNAKSEFGHYNPMFVQWLTKHMIPNPESSDIRWLMQPVFDQYLKYTARAYFLAAQIAFEDITRLERAVKDYKKAMTKGEAGCWSVPALSAAVSEFFVPTYLNGEWYYANVLECALAFWARRYMDGTAEAFQEGLSRLLQAYDSQFMADVTGSFPDVESAGPQGEPLAAALASDRILKRFLDDVKTAVDSHDWEMALTYFGEDNYRMQLEIGIQAPQYIAESLGLGFEDNRLPNRPGDPSAFGKLNAIERLALETITPLDRFNIRIVEGKALLYDGSERYVSLMIRKTATGGYVIEPPLG